MSENSRIAIIGMACRFPRSRDLRAYWQNLRRGVECTQQLTDAELEAAGVPRAELEDPRYVKSAALLDEVACFDAGFFGFSPRDAAILDPQHRHFLEICWEAFEDAGHDPARFEGAIGVFAGSGHNAYLPYNLLSNRELLASVGFFALRHTGNDKDFLTTRVSYCLNLRGPSVAVQTACSTSLVAIHLASQSLLSGECDMALAGGVTIELPHGRGYRHEEGEILSPDGHCRAFDRRSQGTIFSSGAGVVLLRRLEDARRAGDNIRAVILGSAINNDGSQKVGYLAPSVDAQAAAVSEALAVAEVDASSLSYVEAHGTGTPVGDPIEIAALTRAFRASSEGVGHCHVGSVKTNIGHADTAAGVAGLIKVVRALEERELPASLHFEEPNPALELDSTPFRVSAGLTPWVPRAGEPLRAGVNCLGVGGTNAFAVLEEAPRRAASAPGRAQQLLLTSARSAAAADATLERLAAHLEEHPAQALADVAYTLQTGRRAFAHRRALVCHDHADAVGALRTRGGGRVLSQIAPEQPPRVMFLFPGGGAQHTGMARELYEREPVYREWLDRCLALLRPRIGDLAPLLFPPADQHEAAAERLLRPSMSLPALFATEYALAQLWMAWGVTPAALLGHSMGEYTAACLASVFSLEDAISLVAMRGQLFEKVEPGSMLSIALGAEELAPLIGSDLDLAAINAPALCVASGPTAAVLALQERLAEREVEAQLVAIPVAAHSRLLDSILPEFARLTRSIRFHEPRIPFLSNVSGAFITAQQATDPAYWQRHLRHTVRFAACVQSLLADEQEPILLEVGPGRALSSFARTTADELGRRPLCLGSLRHAREAGSDLAHLTGVVARLWCAGVNIDWAAQHAAGTRHRVPLPAYPWEHQRHWIEPASALAPDAPAATPDLRKRGDVGRWFYQPCWLRAPLAGATPWPRRVLLLGGDALREELVRQLRAAGHSLVSVTAGSRFERCSADAFLLEVGRADDYAQLLSELAREGRAPDVILDTLALSDLHAISDGGFEALLALAQGISRSELGSPLEVIVVSQRMQQVAGEELLHPEQATLLGACKVMEQELALGAVRSIDVDPVAPGWRAELLALQLVDELASPSSDRVIALRGHQRLTQTFEPLALAEPLPGSSPLRDEGVYLITGGLGGIGLALAEHLAHTRRARLVLVGRNGLPARADWPAWLAEHDVDDATSVKIRRVIEMERDGARLSIVAADVTDAAEMSNVIARAREEHGALHGVFHAAGVLDDGVIALKTPASALAVLAPKVAGALALDTALGSGALDFLVLFSSVSSLTGLPGQVDYAAANAFLDAFAHARLARTGQRTVALNWSAWRDVGMAAALASRLGVMSRSPRPPAGRPTAHPWLERCVRETERSRCYATLLSASTHWVLADHRLRSGQALLPGTAYLELARAAFSEPGEARPRGPRHTPCELRDVLFVAPFMLDPDEARELRVTLEQGASGTEFVIASTAGGSTIEHARGDLRALASAAPAPASLMAIAERCTRAERHSHVLEDEPHVAFGPRWANRVSTRCGTGEALLELRLAEAFAADGELLGLHPALLDFATAGAQELLADVDLRKQLYVPVSYGVVRVHRPLPAHLYSHVRLRSGGSRDPEARYDVTLYDEDGQALVEIGDFTMRRVASSRLLGHVLAARQAAPARRQPTANKILELTMQHGILASEGLAAMERVLAAPALPQVVVCSQDLCALLASARAERAPSAAGVPGTAMPGTRGARPMLATAYASPSTSLERSIASIFEELLGIDGVGVHDDFFELGGHSLLLTQLLSRVRKQTRSEIRLRVLFERRTIAAIAAEVEAGQSPGATPPPLLAPVARDAYRTRRSALLTSAGNSSEE